MLRCMQTCSAITKFILLPSPSFHKLSNLPRYCSLYIRMLDYNDVHHSKLKSLHEQHIKQSGQPALSAQLSSTKQSIKQKIVHLNAKRIAEENKKQLTETNLRQTLKHYVNKGFEYMGLYYESLQSLVQGKREVLHNEQHKFEDGETVKQKSEKFQLGLRQLIGKSSKRSGQNENENEK